MTARKIAWRVCLEFVAGEQFKRRLDRVFEFDREVDPLVEIVIEPNVCADRIDENLGHLDVGVEVGKSGGAHEGKTANAVPTTDLADRSSLRRGDEADHARVPDRAAEFE
jgi:hypothetical protein